MVPNTPAEFPAIWIKVWPFTNRLLNTGFIKHIPIMDNQAIVLLIFGLYSYI
jgi:hypothetical protein